jgi:hypothetical protein
MVAKQVFVPLSLAGLLSATASAVAQAQQSIEELPSGLRKAVVEATYGVVQDGQAWSARNPAQKMHSRFTAEDGERVAGADGENSWSLGLELESWGRSDALVSVEAVQRAAPLVAALRQGQAHAGDAGRAVHAPADLARDLPLGRVPNVQWG